MNISNMRLLNINNLSGAGEFARDRLTARLTRVTTTLHEAYNLMLSINGKNQNTPAVVENLRSFSATQTGEAP